MTVRVLFFAQARDRAGQADETLELGGDATIADALAVLRQRHPQLEPLWPHLAVAVDGELAASDTPLRAHSEIALLPPVSGG
jgi:molybdopterin synthase catalytic subunit